MGQACLRIGFGVAIIAAIFAIILLVNDVGTYSWRNTGPTHRTFGDWKLGYLDIVHGRLGPTVFTYVIFPNGTSVVIDLGEVNRTEWNMRNPDAIAVPHYPDGLTRVAERALGVIRRFAPRLPPRLDYAIATHYHSDHVGQASMWMNQNGSESKENYQRVGLNHLLNIMSCDRIFDRGTSKPDIISVTEKKDMDNYLSYRKTTAAETLQACLSDQLRADSAHVTTLKSGRDVCMNGVIERMEWVNITENELSVALLFEYGKCSYLHSSDNEGRALRAVAQGLKRTVDVMTPGHHGMKVEGDIVSMFNPQAFVHRTWCAAQPENVSARTMLRIPSFSTDLHPDRERALISQGLHYMAARGTIVVRMHPPGRKQKIEIVALDERARILKGKMFDCRGIDVSAT